MKKKEFEEQFIKIVHETLEEVKKLEFQGEEYTPIQRKKLEREYAIKIKKIWNKTINKLTKLIEKEYGSLESFRKTLRLPFIDDEITAMELALYSLRAIKEEVDSLNYRHPSLFSMKKISLDFPF